LNLREKVLAIATKAHAGETDKAGVPYINHPVAVAANFTTDDDQYMTALLHDVVEDTSETLETLLAYGVPRAVVDAVGALTKREGEEYFEYLSRVKRNPIAKDVKIADIRHNSDLSRLSEITPKDEARAAKYEKALMFLTQ
jgi:(p)ppGpp synthase/HD superfamily hydrolase